MKNIIIGVLFLFFITGCNSGNNSDQANIPAGVHKILVKEVLQTSQYTYLNVTEGNTESWLAIQKMPVETGETYYYKDGLPMADFVSKELNRTFKEILFVDNISNDPSSPDLIAAGKSPGEKKDNSAMNDSENKQNESIANSTNASSSPANKIVAKEVLQTNQYTYIRGMVDDKEQWIAVSKMEVNTGKTYYFNGGLPMTNFNSKELNKTFKEILFVDNISVNAPVAGNNKASEIQNDQPVSTGSAIPLEKKTVQMKHDKGDITIAMLLENRKSYAGKSIKIKGQITKFTPAIMKKNWIHLQDGTESSGKFDLTITTDQEFNVGDYITAEGIIAIDKDFGYGYIYEIIMEDAKIIK